MQISPRSNASALTGTGAGDAEKLSTVRARFQREFRDKASDPEAFHAFLRQVFGDDYDVATAEAYRTAALRGDFAWMPEVRLVPAEVLHGGLGAYDGAGDVIYLNADLLGDLDLAVSTLTEEMGHFLDRHLKTTDTAGDEGAVFRHLFAGDSLSTGRLAALRAEDDSGEIVVDGQVIEVEFREEPGGLLGMLIDMVQDVADRTQRAVNGTARERLDALLRGYDPEDGDADALAERIANDPELAAALTREERAMLIEGLFDGWTKEGEEDAAVSLLLDGTSKEDLEWLVNEVGWDTLRDELDAHDIDRIAHELATRHTDAIEGLFAELGIQDPSNMAADDLAAAITARLDGMSDADVQALVARVLGPDGNADELLDAVAQMVRTGSGHQSETLSSLKVLVRALAARSGEGTASELTRLDHQIRYTEELVESLKNGDYGTLIGSLDDLFHPDLSDEQRHALRETLRRYEPEIRAMEEFLRQYGDTEQRSKLERFVSAKREALNLFDETGGELPDANALTRILNDVFQVFEDGVDELKDAVRMLALALADATGLLDDAFGRALGNVDDDQAREIAGLLGSKDGRAGAEASLLAHLSFDAKVALLEALMHAGFLDFCGDGDERAILDILRETLEDDPAEFFRLVDAVGYGELDAHLHGDEWDEFVRLMDEATRRLTAA